MADHPVTLVDCDCRARVHGDGSGVELDYCDVHAAAADLAAALGDLTTELTQTRYWPAVTPAVRDRVEKALAAAGQ